MRKSVAAKALVLVLFSIAGQSSFAADAADSVADNLNVANTSLDAAIAAALADEPSLRAKIAGVAMASARLDAAKANNKSTLGLNGSYGYSHAKFGPVSMFGDVGYRDIYPSNLTIAWEKRLYDGGQSLANISEADFALAAENGEYQNARNKLVVDVVSAYVGVVVAEKNVEFANDNLNAVERFAHDAELMFKAGEIPVSEKAGANARLAMAQAALAHANAAQNIANAELLRLTNMEISADKIPEFNITLPASQAHAIEYALINHPLLQAGKARLEAAKASYKAANANYRPKVSASVAAGTTRDQFIPGYKHDEVGAYINVTMPLWDNGKIAAGTSQARHAMEAARNTLEATERMVKTQIIQAYAAYDGANAEFNANKDALNASQIAMKSTEAEMRVGERPLSDVLDAQSNLTQAQATLIKAQGNLLIAKYQILAATGEGTGK